MSDGFSVSSDSNIDPAQFIPSDPVSSNTFSVKPDEAAPHRHEFLKEQFTPQHHLPTHSFSLHFTESRRKLFQDSDAPFSK